MGKKAGYLHLLSVFSQARYGNNSVGQAIEQISGKYRPFLSSILIDIILRLLYLGRVGLICIARAARQAQEMYRYKTLR